MAETPCSLGPSAPLVPSQPSPISLEDLEVLLRDGGRSPEPLSAVGSSDQLESSDLASTAVLGPDTPRGWEQMEERVAELQAEVVALGTHRDHCERAMLGLLRELLQVRTRLQRQEAELGALQQEVQRAARAPEEMQEVTHASLQNQKQMQALDKRLLEVRDTLGRIRRQQALQDSERKGAEQEASLRFAQLSGELKQEGQAREAACGSLRRDQEEASQRVEQDMAQMQAQVTKLGEEMSLRFLKREAKLCGFLQKSFQALEKRMKATESTRLKAEGSLREELDVRWQKLQELDEARVQAMLEQCRQEERRVVERCQGLDDAVVRLTTFVRQNQESLNHILVAQKKAQDTKGRLEESQAEEVAFYLQESQDSLEAMRLAGTLAQQETQDALELLQEKNRALDLSLAQLAQQVKDLSDHFLALNWRLDLQERTLSLRLSEARCEWEHLEQDSRASLAQGQQEVEAQLREVQETVGSLPRQIEAFWDKCVLHKSDLDLKISAEGRAREMAVGGLRQELAALLTAVQLLKEDNSGRKIAEIQGKLTTFQNQMMRLENSMQDHRAIQNLKFNTETKLRSEAMAALQESVMRLWGEQGLVAPAWQRLFIKDTTPSALVSLNRWGVYQALRWSQWKAELLGLLARSRCTVRHKLHHGQPFHQPRSLPPPPK
ncbi:coiled-coil domain-containing protein 154 [Sorex araneus]|uniref:coiled-coil domain-containing protein 154 n=1 Tax=Sorex araneus TaxID=42254 RepID=UPI002433AFC1|nr:coiled-coil domain-containing protein 154 [Sorex araneus]